MLKKTQHTNPDGSIVTIYLGDRASIGEGARIGNSASIFADAGIGDRASIGEGARIGEDARIGEGARIGDRASIGEDARIGEGARIGEDARIGEGARIGESARIGDRAMRYAVRSDGYVFTVGERDGEKRIFAGCRDFNLAKARKHWDAKHKHGNETNAILDFLFGEY